MTQFIGDSHQFLPYPDPWEQELKKAKERIDKFKPKARTFHDGANTERTAILSKLRRERKKAARQGASLREVTDNPMYAVLVQLETWLLTRNERYRKNPGGL